MAHYPVAAFIRTLRRIADLSQREIADRCGLTRHVIASMEARPDLARVVRFEQLVEAAGLRLVILDGHGSALEPDHDRGLRDRGGRRFPAHLDVRPAAEGWWGSSWPMFFGREPLNTFDRNRWVRDRRRDHLRLLPDLQERVSDE
jgi:transcriptional regulator with XRE-family HTH domain